MGIPGRSEHRALAGKRAALLPEPPELTVDPLFLAVCGIVESSPARIGRRGMTGAR